jgi:hypothetical protein
VGISVVTGKESGHKCKNGICYGQTFFPEWNRLKEKNTFCRYEAPILYMAGFCDWFDDRKMEEILYKVSVQLKREMEYEQQSLFM